MELQNKILRQIEEHRESKPQYFDDILINEVIKNQALT